MQTQSTYPSPLDDQDFAELGVELDSESWRALEENRPALADAVRKAVGRGRNADEVRRFVYRRTRNQQIAQHCQQAARHLISQKQTGIVMMSN